MKSIKKLVLKTSNIKWSNESNATKKYIDLSSVDRTTLKIKKTDEIDSQSAPSRAKKIVNQGDVIFATTRPTLKRVAIIPEKYDEQIASTGYCVLRPIHDQLDSKYLYYFIRSEAFNSRMEKLQRGASYPAVTDSDVKETLIPVPPLDVQRRIVARLDAAFAALDQAQANVEQNQSNIDDLWQSSLTSLFSADAPKATMVKLKDIIEVKHGFAFKSEFFQFDGKFELLTPGNFHEIGGYRYRGKKQRYYVGEFPSEYILREGDLLVAMTEQAAGLLGSSMLIPSSNTYLHNQRLGLISTKDNAISNEYLYHLFNTPIVRKELFRSGTGLKVRHTSPTKIGEVSVYISRDEYHRKHVVDTLNEIAKYKQYVSRVTESRLEQIGELRRSLLVNAFIGKLI